MPTTTSARMSTVAKTGRRTQSSASFCMGFLRSQLDAGEEPGAQTPIGVGEFGFGEEGPGGRVDDAAHGLDAAGELLAGVGVHPSDDRLPRPQLTQVALGDAEAQFQRRRLPDDEGGSGFAQALARAGLALGPDAGDGLK